MIRFYNGSILKFSPEAQIVSGEVWVEGSTIVCAGAPGEKPEGGFEREIDLEGGVVIPGFKNAHTHTAMTFMRSLADDEPLETWYHNTVFPSEAKLTEDSLYWFTKLGIMEYVRGGVTAAFEMYYLRDAYVKACTGAGFRTVLCGGMNNYDEDPTMVERDYLKYNNSGELISYQLGVHGEYTTCIERLEYVASLAEKYQAPCFAHISETYDEVQGCLLRYSRTPPKLLNDIGFFKYGGGGFHFVHVNDEDIEIFAENKLWAASCPCSNLKLASGIAPLEKLRKRGVNLALGTDGAASNNALSMFREMYLASALQKAQTGDATAMPAGSVLKMACVGGAEMMRLNDCTGIEAGKKADLAVIGTELPNMRPVNNMISEIVYAGSSSNVKLTMINGKIVYENGEYFIGDSAEEIYARTAEYSEKFKCEV